ncbi:MAG TPA: type IV toxin-antitoxin system AbiEi family antitoxin domain-containing protein [Mycobacteriales bacterium]|nr:type IV toxin-antitoxin system AbiEi family antitoxin domain-containing protein [Mycobacteriales bacterium]
MPRKVVTPPLAATARAQHGALSAGQARWSGVDRRTLARLAEAGVLVRDEYGVYTVVGAPVTPLQRAWVAILAVGAPCALRAEWALWAQGLIRYAPSGPPQVGVPHTRKLVRRDGALLRRISWWRAEARVDQIDALGGLPVLSTVDAIVTAAPHVSDATLLAAVQEATFRGDLSLPDLIRRRRRGLPGSPRIGRVVTTYLRGHDSVFEATTYAVLTDGDNSGMHCNVVVTDGHGRRIGPVDGYHEDGAAYEADGRAWHSRRRHVDRDARKDALAASIGLPLPRFTTVDIADGAAARARWLDARATARAGGTAFTVEHQPGRSCPCGHRAAA